MILYSEFTDGSQFSEEKKWFENLFLGCSENQETIKNRNYTFFTGHPLTHKYKVIQGVLVGWSPSKYNFFYRTTFRAVLGNVGGWKNLSGPKICGLK